MTNRKQALQQITNAVGSHGVWKLKLKTALATNAHGIDLPKVACDSCCEFGWWLNGPTLDPDIRSSVPYRTVKRLHGEFHQSAARVARLVIDSRPDEAAKVLEGEFADRSDKLIRALSLWKREMQQRE